MKRTLLLIFSLVCVLTIGATPDNYRRAQRTELAGLHVKRAPFTLTASKATSAVPKVAATVGVAVAECPRLNATSLRAPKHAPGMKDLYGSYIEDTPGATDGLEPTIVCMPTEVGPYEYTDEETGEKIVLVNFSGLCQGVANVSGEYDPEEGTIFIPAQICFDDPSNVRVPKASLFGIESIDARGQLVLKAGITLRVQEDANGLYITMDEDEQVGWALYAEEGEWKGSVVGYAEYLTLNPTTHHLTYAYLDIGMPAAERLWYEGGQGSFVEDLGNEVFIHGWLGEYAIRLTVKDNGDIVLRNGQKAYYGISDRMWWSCYTFGSDRKMTIDPAVESPVIKNTAGTYIFGSNNEATGGINWDIFCWGYVGDNGQGKWTGVEYANVGLVPNAVWEELSGIEGAPSVSPRGESSVAYDLQGRRVSAAARGLFIQGGKKVLGR